MDALEYLVSQDRKVTVVVLVKHVSQDPKERRETLHGLDHQV